MFECIYTPRPAHATPQFTHAYIFINLPPPSPCTSQSPVRNALAQVKEPGVCSSISTYHLDTSRCPFAFDQPCVVRALPSKSQRPLLTSSFPAHRTAWPESSAVLTATLPIACLLRPSSQVRCVRKSDPLECTSLSWTGRLLAHD